MSSVDATSSLRKEEVSVIDTAVDFPLLETTAEVHLMTRRFVCLLFLSDCVSLSCLSY
jgi:hypothetical protein